MSQQILLPPMVNPKIMEFQNKIDNFLTHSTGNFEQLRSESVEILNNWLVDSGSIIRVPLDYGIVAEMEHNGEKYWVIHKMTNIPMDFLTPYFNWNKDIIVEQGIDLRTNKLHFRNILYRQSQYSKNEIEKVALKLWKCPRCIEGYTELYVGSTETVQSQASETLKNPESRIEGKEISFSGESSMAEQIERQIDDVREQVKSGLAKAQELFNLDLSPGEFALGKVLATGLNSLVNFAVVTKSGQAAWKGIPALVMLAIAAGTKAAGTPGASAFQSKLIKSCGLLGIEMGASALESLAEQKPAMSFEENEIVREFQQFTQAMRYDLGDAIKGTLSEPMKAAISQIGFALGGIKPLQMLPGFPYDALTQIKEDPLRRKDLTPMPDVQSKLIHIKSEGPYGI